MRKQSGFTLVELAIVLMIIGLLIAGVLRGQELLTNAKISKTIQQVKAYQGAVVNFRDAYGMMPGDMSNATLRLPGCNTGNSCNNGDGNGIVGTLGQLPNDTEPWGNVSAVISSESSQFWKHLALTHLITGVTPSANAMAWGKSNPTNAFAGGFYAKYVSTTSFITITAHILILRKNNWGGWQCNIGGQMENCAISGKYASQIDRKMDDGVAMTGDVIALSGNWGNGCGINSYGLNGRNGYAETNETTTCDMMFRFN